MENQLGSVLSREDTSGPMPSMEAIFLTATIDAYEGQDIMVLNVTNVFIQAIIPPNKYGKEMVIMKITGVLVDIPVGLDSKTYRKHVVLKMENIYIYVVVLR